MNRAMVTLLTALCALHGSTAVYAQTQEDAVSTHTRMTVGVEQSGASSADTATRFIVDFYMSAPLSPSRWLLGEPGQDEKTNCEPTKNECIPNVGVFADFRLTGVTRQIASPAKTFAASFVNQTQETKVNEIAQGFQGVAGIELGAWPGPSFGAADGSGNVARVFVSFIAGGGFSTPISPKAGVQVFRINEEAKARIPELKDTTKEFVAFVPTERTRFFRQYFAGIRLKTYVTDNKTKKAKSFPNILDITLGRNEEVTGGAFVDTVMRVEGFYSLPNIPVFVFGTLLMNLRESEDVLPLLLATPDAAVPVPGPNVAVLPRQTVNRDQ